MSQLNVRVDDDDAKWFKIQCIVNGFQAVDMFRLMRAAIVEVGVTRAAQLRLAGEGIAHGPGQPVSVGRPPDDETAEG